MKNEFTLTVMINAGAAEVYQAWLSSEGHGAMTGSPAIVDGRVDGLFSAWDGYISGRFLELEPDRRIVQGWRTTEFPAQSGDSIVEILLEEGGTDGLAAARRTRLTLKHTNIPGGQAESYKTGWEDFYFKPMTAYFG